MKLLSRKEALQELAERRIGDNYITNDWLAKHYIYLLSNSGDLIEIDRPKITSVIYYNDELPAPSTDFDAWKEYNMVYNFNDSSKAIDKWIEDVNHYREIGCCSGRLLLHPTYLRGADGYSHAMMLYTEPDFIESRKDIAIELNDAETAEYINCIQTIKEDYIKRLKTYYKKYPHKIYTYGYWANR